MKSFIDIKLRNITLSIFMVGGILYCRPLGISQPPVAANQFADGNAGSTTTSKYNIFQAGSEDCLGIMEREEYIRVVEEETDDLPRPGLRDRRGEFQVVKSLRLALKSNCLSSDSPDNTTLPSSQKSEGTTALNSSTSITDNIREEGLAAQQFSSNTVTPESWILEKVSFKSRVGDFYVIKAANRRDDTGAELCWVRKKQERRISFGQADTFIALEKCTAENGGSLDDLYVEESIWSLHLVTGTDIDVKSYQIKGDVPGSMVEACLTVKDSLQSARRSTKRQEYQEIAYTEKCSSDAKMLWSTSVVTTPLGDGDNRDTKFYTITFGWDPNLEKGLDNYKLYRKFDKSDDYMKPDDVIATIGKVDGVVPTTVTISVEAGFKYYFALTADSDDPDIEESLYSNDVLIDTTALLVH